MARGAGPFDPAEFRRRRLAAGLTQQQVADQLNLDVSVIHWIEHDDFAALGAPVFARGHLRRYSMMLGLPPERLLEAYEQAGTHPSQPTLIPRARVELMPARAPQRWPWVLAGIAGALLLAAMAAFVVERWSNRAGPSAPATATVDPAPAEVPAETAAAEVAPAAPSPPASEQAGNGDRVSLKLTFSKDTWVEVYDGSGAAVLYDLGSKGGERTVRATPPLSVTLGDPASVVVYANGRRLTVPAAPAGQSLTRFSIDATGAVR